ncbi:MAG TPA: hypothetical protein VGD00_01145 [Solirubrobacteraceae bacterium]|jgi:hypothetical protein
MEPDLPRPDLSVVLPLDPYAPRAARHRVCQVGRPSPDLRDAVKLLCSELVTLAVESSGEGSHVELRMWMPEDVVRVELEGWPSAGLHAPDPDTFASLLLNQIADRWALDAVDGHARMWFEIDRHPAPVAAAR